MSADIFYFANLLLLSLSEVILDVESLPDFLRSFPLDHVGHSLAGHIQESLIREGRPDMTVIAQHTRYLDVEVVGGEDQLEQSALVDL